MREDESHEPDVTEGGEEEEEDDFLKKFAEVKKTLRHAKKREALKEVLASTLSVKRLPEEPGQWLPDYKTALEKRLARCEALAVETLGQGAAVSLDRVRVKGVWSCVATVWDAKGVARGKLSGEGKMEAIGALMKWLKDVQENGQG